MSRANRPGPARLFRDQRLNAPVRSWWPVRRALILFTIALAVISGAALAETRAVILSPAVAGDNSSRRDANIALVERFYEAVNDAVRTGDVGPVERVLARDFVDRTPPPGSSSDRTGLTTHLKSLHAIAPTAQLTILDLIYQDDRIVALVRLDGAEGASFLGMPVAPTLLWGAVDVLGVRAGEIVEHWGDPARTALFAPLLSVTVPAAPPLRRVVALERWVFNADAIRHDRTKSGALVLLVESGKLAVGLDRDSPASVSVVSAERAGRSRSTRLVPRGGQDMLIAGDALVLPRGSRYALTSREPATALVLSMAALPVGHGTLTSGDDGDETPKRSPISTSGITRVVLAGNMAVDLPAGDVAIEFGRVGLARDATLPPHITGAAELVAVETGALALSVGVGTAWVMPQTGGAIGPSASATLLPGGGALITRGAVIVCQSAGSETLGLLLVGIRSDPAHASPGTPITSAR